MSFDCGQQIYGIAVNDAWEPYVAVGSLSLNKDNSLMILKVSEEGKLVLDFQFYHEYPATKILWSPPLIQ